MLTSPIDINAPTRSALVLAITDSFVSLFTDLNNNNNNNNNNNKFNSEFLNG